MGLQHIISILKQQNQQSRESQLRDLTTQQKAEAFADLMGIPMPNVEETNIDLEKEEITRGITATKDCYEKFQGNQG